MAITHVSFPGYSPASPLRFDVEGMAQLGVHAIFRARPIATDQYVLNQLERRERIVLLLLDGKRSLRDVARLVHRGELEMAHILVRLLERGYIEFLGAEVPARAPTP